MMGDFVGISDRATTGLVSVAAGGVSAAFSAVVLGVASVAGQITPDSILPIGGLLVAVATGVAVATVRIWKTPGETMMATERKELADRITFVRDQARLDVEAARQQARLDVDAERRASKEARDELEAEQKDHDKTRDRLNDCRRLLNETRYKLSLKVAGLQSDDDILPGPTPPVLPPTG